MAVNLHGRSLLTLKDFSREEIRYLLDLASALKSKKRVGSTEKSLLGKNIVLLFDKTSTRTRCSFEIAALDEGAHVTFLDNASSQFNKKESIEDSARVLGRFYDGIEYRGFEQKIVEDLAKFSGVPVYNGLTDVDHPTQILADLMTMEEHLHKPLDKCKVVFVGDTRNNMSLAWMTATAKIGLNYIGLGPKELHPEPSVIEQFDESAREFGGSIWFTDNADDIKNADVVYTDVWVSMGEEAEMETRVRLLTPYRLDTELFSKIAAQDSIFMHCLPAFHDFETIVAKNAQSMGFDVREVTDEVFRAPYSVVFDEAENRMHTIKAILVSTLK
jgi:ornithine carbamoyltransferase